jgi:putative MATE family efflux protein
MRSVIRLAWPMVLGNMLQNMFNVVDMIFVGRLGPTSIAAVSLCGMLMSITWTLLVGVSVGTSALVARFYGSKDYGMAGFAGMQSLTLGLIVALIIALLGICLGREILSLLGAQGGVLLEGDQYLKIVFIGSFCLIFFFLCSSIMRGSGDSLTPMIIMSVCTVINIGLDPLLIFGLWIFPPMGVRGAAIATVTAQAIGMIAALFILSRGYTRLRLPWKSYRLDTKLVGRILKIALPATIQGAVRSASGLVTMRIVAAFGVFALAGYGIGLRLDIIIMMPGWALGATTLTLVGQNLGANRPERAQKSAWIATLLYIIILTFFGTAFLLWAEGVIGIFNRTPQVVTLGSAYIRITTLSYAFLAMSIVLANALNGAGDAVSPMIILAVTFLGIRIALAYLLPNLFGLRTTGIWIAVSASYAVQGIAMAVAFRAGNWKRRRV